MDFPKEVHGPTTRTAVTMAMTVRLTMDTNSQLLQRIFIYDFDDIINIHEAADVIIIPQIGDGVIVFRRNYVIIDVIIYRLLRPE